MIEFRGETWTISDVEHLCARLENRLPAFVPAWQPGSAGPGRALLEITARYVRLLADRLSRAPDKGKLAFLDTLGVDAIPAQPARCPVVFELLPGAAHGTAPARARLGAQGVNDAAGKALEFETESAIALAASRLMEVKAILPGDQYVDHTSAVFGEMPFTLFESPQSIPRELYLAHDPLLALMPGSRVDIGLELAANTGGAEGPALDWQYFDGLDWVAFAPLDPALDTKTADTDNRRDSARNLQSTGTTSLRVGEKPIAPTTVRGIKSYWIRAVVRPASIDPSRAADNLARNRPEIERLRLSVVNTVAGFRVLHRTESIVQSGSPSFRIRLVDENGALLDGSTYSLARLPGPVLEKDDVGFTQPAAIDGDTIKVRISWERPAGKDKHPSSIVVLNFPRLDRNYDFDLARAGRSPDVAFGNGLKLDTTTSFFPFGQLPVAGTTFLFSCPEVTSKPRARVNVFTEVSAGPDGDPPFKPAPKCRWEYWNGSAWAPLPELTGSPDVLAFLKSGEVQFTMPANIAVKNELGQDKAWLRVHLVEGGYLAIGGGKATAGKKPITFDKVFPPTVRTFRLEYQFTSAAEPLQNCLMFNEFLWSDLTARVKFGGDPVDLFPRNVDARPMLFLGFSRTLPTDLISLFFNVSCEQPLPEHPLTWEYWDGAAWRTLTLKLDGTRQLCVPGLVQFVWPGTSLPDPDPASAAEGKLVRFFEPRTAARFRPDDKIAVFADDDAELAEVAAVAGTDLILTAPLEKKAAAPRVGMAPAAPFGTPRQWVRIIWPDGPAPGPDSDFPVKVQGIYVNAVWAENTRTHDKELLGSTKGTAGELFDFAQFPVMTGETVEVLELQGALAEAQWAALAAELQPNRLRLQRDDKTKKVRQVWVRWEGRSNFSASSAADRHYVVERTRGRLQFGDGRAGMLPPVNPNNVLVTYRSGGGVIGNIPPRTIQVVLGSIPGAQKVFNPIAAAGGADGELVRKPADAQNSLASAAAILRRGPQLVRHRYRALTPLDYEQLALAASPGVACARVVAPADATCDISAGNVRVLVVPVANETDPEPVPSRQLCLEVQTYLRARMPATAQLEVTAPTYFPVGVEAMLTPRAPEAAGELARQARAGILKFLHPVVGGPKGQGWPFNADVHRSDLVAFLHRQLGELLAFVEQIYLLNAGVPAAEELQIPADRLPCAGPIRIRLSANAEVST